MRFGGRLKSKTVHGVKSGNHSNPNVLRAARATGGSCGTVGGDDSRPSLSKPGRMRRADGGGVQISEDSKKEAARLRASANTDNNWAKGHTAIGALNSTAAVAAAKRMPGVGLANGVGAVWNAKQGLNSLGARDEKIREADRIEKGQAEPGKEDGGRKRGGRVSKKDCD